MIITTENGEKNVPIPVSTEGDALPVAAKIQSDPESGTSSSLQLPADALVIVPVRKMVLFPGAVLPIIISGSRARAAAQYAVRHQLRIGILLQRPGDVEVPGPDDLHWVGSAANVLR